MTIVQYEQPAPLPPSRPGDEREPGPAGLVARLRAAAEIANHIAQTDFVPQAMRNNPPAIAAAIMYGQEIGLDPMQSLTWIVVIQGRPALLAEAKRALILAAGHELWIEEQTSTRVIAAGRRKGEDRIGRVTWTMDDANRAGLKDKTNWRAYPREMLIAKATATLARQMFPDVTGGLAAAEDLDDTANGVAPAQTVETTAEKPKTRRRSRPAAAAPAPPTPPPDTQPEPEPEPEEPKVTDAQKRRIFALMRDLGVPDDRGRRLTYTAHIIGHPIESSNDLTRREAGLVIDDLEATAQVKAKTELDEIERQTEQ